MDFRLVDPGTLTWTRTPRGQPMARAPDGAKVIVQSPRCGCRPVSMRSGMYKLVMTLREDVAAHNAFAQWTEAIEACAAADPTVTACLDSRTLSSGVYCDDRGSDSAPRRTVRFMAFGDTLAFDQDGKLSADYLDATACTVLLELQGVWVTDGRWGLRWKVLQFKFSTDDADADAAGNDDDGVGGGVAQPNLFVDDD